MGSSFDIGALVAALAGSLAAQVPPAAPDAAQLPRRLPEVVLSGADAAVSLVDFQLGSGGIAANVGTLRLDPDDGCVTPGGVRVCCRGAAGVKLTFASGRELLVSTDGRMHLRGGEHTGRFRAGVELMLADGARVRIRLAPGARRSLREVDVVHGDRSLRLWHRGKSARKVGNASRAGSWAGVRVACCGDGGAIYRPLAIGPLAVLDRLLVPAGQQNDLPPVRLVLMRDPLHESLRTMQRQHREPDAAVRKAIAAVAAVAERAHDVLPQGAALPRADRRRLRWSLPEGFELQLELDGSQLPRLQLFVGRSPLPMVEWTLSRTSVAFLNNPREDRLGKRWHGNGTRLPDALEDLQVREHLGEQRLAMLALGRLVRNEPR